SVLSRLIPIWKWECGFGFAELTFRNTKSVDSQAIASDYLRIQSFILVLGRKKVTSTESGVEK
ncbi:MAG: hypothetical protein MUD08_03230, partial [Cytophagales bacterium]|nr:hypothetical protein [Cytophagales bacterium]